MRFVDTIVSSGWEAIMVVVLSCFVGTAISHAGTTCREALSATSFNVVGNLSKAISIFLSILIFGQEHSTSSLVGLSIVLVSGALYGLKLV